MPQILDYYPHNKFNEIKHIKGKLYEAYLQISDELVSQSTFDLKGDYIKHNIEYLRTLNYWVKGVYLGYRIPSMGLTIYTIELIKLKKPRVELGL